MEVLGRLWRPFGLSGRLGRFSTSFFLVFFAFGRTFGPQGAPKRAPKWPKGPKSTPKVVPESPKVLQTEAQGPSKQRKSVFHEFDTTLQRNWWFWCPGPTQNLNFGTLGPPKSKKNIKKTEAREKERKNALKSSPRRPKSAPESEKERKSAKKSSKSEGTFH